MQQINQTRVTPEHVIAFRAEEGLRKRLKAFAVWTGSTVQDICHVALLDYLSQRADEQGLPVSSAAKTAITRNRHNP